MEGKSFGPAITTVNFWSEIDVSLVGSSLRYIIHNWVEMKGK
jgi:hypothetical protein